MEKSKIIEITIQGMHCAACSARIERILSKLEGIQSINVNLSSRIGQIILYPDLITEESILAIIKKAGFQAEIHKPLKSEYNKHKQHLQAEAANKFKDFVLMSIFAIPLLIISMWSMFKHFLPFFNSFDSIFFSQKILGLEQLFLTLPIIWLGRKFYSRGLMALIRKTPNMDSLIAMGTGAAFIYSVVELWLLFFNSEPNFHPTLYFESAGVLIAIISLGKYLESRAMFQTMQSIQALLNLTPNSVTIIKNGIMRATNIENVIPGDLLFIKPGERIPVDGIVRTKNVYIDEAMLSGEALPVKKQEGDWASAGTLNTKSSFNLEAKAVGEETQLAHIINLVKRAQMSKAPIANLADKISIYFVPLVLSIATLTFVFWLTQGATFSIALKFFVTVLVIACPCAMGLATPVAVMVGIGRGAQLGILIRNATALQNASTINHIVFDKTGTLTHGKPKVSNIIITNKNYSEKDIITFAGAIEKNSDHPIAQAIFEHAKDNTLPEITETTEEQGLGMVGVIDGQQIHIGNLELMTIANCANTDEAFISGEDLALKGEIPIYLAIKNQIIAVIGVSDTLRKEAKQVIFDLKSKNIESTMLTGDNEITAKIIASKLGISNVVSGVKPEGKKEYIQNLQKQGFKVAMVGDGINDSPALATANIGIAMGAGIDVAVETSDIILINNSLKDIYLALNLSKASMRNIKQNLFWAFIFNILGIPVAAGILLLVGGPTLNPMFAGGAMGLSSFCVVSNALRLRKFGKNKFYKK